MAPQFADVNLSLKFCSEGLYRTTIPCLCTNSLIVMRVQVDAKTKAWRYIHGEHLLRLIGFFGADADEDDSLCRLLAGNAFSGFTFAAATIAALAAAP
eukprot:3395513-Pyramimonas_sp.AAC.1